MARRKCPSCGKVDEILVIHDKDSVIKKCPNCGYVYITYRAAMKPS
ncbi:hypothetical protein [Sulfuracidifex tepidarius]|uniref:Uncharacterized protein n=1 Tax=Sulfuracidifex tepidarius TaxID=1294262 RepID=A0A510DYX1_9CREN|nr:hypothetical protein [Sulfuracidifex tepidarius]BBG25436.1 hypothetical protein IC006_2772 [Sulfuracidifex tepidarius]BBG28230.1 hypothetical protein IC007_2786 [Sulfuracidifex tepidarius]